MNRDEFKILRRSLGMTQAEFGEWLAREVNAMQEDGKKPVSAYTRQRIHAYEAGDVALPDKIRLVLAAREIASLKQKQRRKQKPKG